ALLDVQQLREMKSESVRTISRARYFPRGRGPLRISVFGFSRIIWRYRHAGSAARAPRGGDFADTPPIFRLAFWGCRRALSPLYGFGKTAVQRVRRRSRLDRSEQKATDVRRGGRH